MPRQPRLDAFRTASGIFDRLLHQVRGRGLERRRFFQEDTDRADFIGRLEALVTATDLTVCTWALLPNFTHLLVRNSGDTLSNW